MKKVAIVGAGLAGCLLACFLTRRGYAVELYERRPDPRSGKAERGRSINLALSERGLDALRRIGLDQQVMKDALPMKGRMIHPISGELDFQQYSADGERAINSIGRGALNNALLDATDARIHFDKKLVWLNAATGQMRFEDGSTAKADIVIGADGAGSAVRGQLLDQGLLQESLDFLDYGYKELTIPAAADGGWVLDPAALHIWPRGKSMMIALPNPDKSFTCTLFWPNGGTASFASLTSPAAIMRHFERNYPDVPPIAPTLVEDYQHNPVGLLGTVRCSPWHASGRVLLLGDAAHAIVPFYGQGANAAFEDVVELDRCLDATGDDWAATLRMFQERRQANSEAIAQMALANFVEMRDKVASPVFQAQKKLEHVLERALPGRYVSRYELVSFSTTPYADVQRRVRRQQQILGSVLGVGVLAAGALVTAALRSLTRRGNR
ncbi:kynurenine 3-monooxygenase [Rhizocola hellebori]|uniref:Kynurenine 3-monooxygenase n=2 Tax=Rhizocola hellebori TaxID=1392758 RepID=A0A8J3QEB2_9ACTN|nr:kynurenine 3-monooxygenase [Rhizocola hellebori]